MISLGGLYSGFHSNNIREKLHYNLGNCTGNVNYVILGKLCAIPVGVAYNRIISVEFLTCRCLKNL